MAAVSIQLMPRSRALWMAAMDSLSSWGPQANSQLPPPMAHAPKPMGDSRRSELPSLRRDCEAGVVVIAIPSMIALGGAVQKPWLLRAIEVVQFAATATLKRLLLWEVLAANWCVIGSFWSILARTVPVILCRLSPEAFDIAGVSWHSTVSQLHSLGLSNERLLGGSGLRGVPPGIPTRIPL